MRIRADGRARRPLRTEAWQGRDDSRSRGRKASTHTHQAHAQPSELFDWDTALFLHAETMKKLGYPLSKSQKEMLKNA